MRPGHISGVWMRVMRGVLPFCNDRRTHRQTRRLVVAVPVCSSFYDLDNKYAENRYEHYRKDRREFIPK